jgi:hypothetical protein
MSGNHPRDLDADGAYSPAALFNERVQRANRAAKRNRALLFFLISLFLFIATVIHALTSFTEIGSSGGGGEAGFVLIGI